MQDTKTYDCKPIRIRMSLITDFIFYPIDSEEFIRLIEQRGYKIQQTQQPIGPFRLELAGKVAEKEGSQIILEPGRQLIAVESIDPLKCIEVFNEIESVIKDLMGIDYSDSVKFYETIVDYHIFTDKNPRFIIEKAVKIDELSNRFSDIIGLPVSPFTIRFGSKEHLPNSTEWIDIRIEPFIRRADQVYAFNLVYRSKDGEDIKDKVQNIEVTIQDLVKTIE